MKRLLFSTLVLTMGLLSSVYAQDFVQLSTGAGYTHQAYYNLADQSSIEVNNDSWDLIFTTFGQQDAGVHVNEASSSIFGVPAPTVELYLTDATDLAAVTAFDSAYVRVYNDEGNWAFGAANNTRNPMNPFDFGWGSYDPASRSVLGNQIYLVKLRSGRYKKLKIESLVFTTYNLTYANLDGTEETTVAIEKTNFPMGLAYFSFEQGTTVDIGVTSFDLLFTRYVTPVLDPATGDTLDYTVTGMLSGPGIEVAKVTGVPSEAVTLETAPTEFDTKLDAIGYDWKVFDFDSSWAVLDSTTYLVKRPNRELYKLVFIDFEGSSTGVATFEQTSLGVISSLNDPHSDFEYLETFPNPAQQELNVVFSLKHSTKDAEIRLVNMLGQQVWQQSVSSNKGLQGIELPVGNLESGQYALVVQAGTSVVTRLVRVQ